MLKIQLTHQKVRYSLIGVLQGCTIRLQQLYGTKIYHMSNVKEVNQYVHFHGGMCIFMEPPQKVKY